MAASFRDRAGQILGLFLLFLVFFGIASGMARLFFTTADSLSAFPIMAHLHLRQGMSLAALLQTPEFVLLVLTGTGLSLLLPVLSPVRASLLTLASALPFLYLGYLHAAAPPVLPMEFSLLAIMLLFVADVVIGYFREARVRQQIVNVFSQYIPPQLVSEISRDPGSLNLSGEARELTVFFCDLQNFSGVSEQMNPRQLTLMLNDYFTMMSEILYQHEATIDKYIGDSIMAFWGAPVRQDDHASRAVTAALHMQQVMHDLSGRFVERDWPALSMGIGINTGMMNVGNMGSRYRISYTVIGDAVNLAARLEGLTRAYQVPCIVSEATMHASDGLLYRPLDVVQVRGKREKTRIYQPLCPEGRAEQALRDTLRRHQQALEDYFNGESAAAARQFRDLARDNPEDGYYRVMLDKLNPA